MNAMQRTRDIEEYAKAYSASYDFELEQVRFRRAAVVKGLLSRRPARVLEVGCGLDPLLPHYLAAGGGGIARWLVVEPAPSFCANARALADQYPEMVVTQGFLETEAAGIRESHGHLDMVICSGLLHEVPDPRALLGAARSLMAEGSLLHVNVPNATSLHRRLAKAMGLIEDLQQMSERNILLQQHRVYSLETLCKDLKMAGLKPIRHGGILLKPFTSQQMVAVLAHLPDRLLDGLGALGEAIPELASEIFVEARLVRE